MSRKHQLILIVLLAIVIAVLGRLYLNAPIAKIQLEAEVVGKDIFGRWDITNSLIAAWISMGIVLLVLFLATRKMTLVPRGVQNFIEFMLDFLLKLIEDVAGKKNGRRFFPLLATIFLFIVVANLTSLTPVFGTIGKVDSAAFEVTHALEEARSEELV